MEGYSVEPYPSTVATNTVQAAAQATMNCYLIRQHDIQQALSKSYDIFGIVRCHPNAQSPLEMLGMAYLLGYGLLTMPRLGNCSPIQVVWLPVYLCPLHCPVNAPAPGCPAVSA